MSRSLGTSVGYYLVREPHSCSYLWLPSRTESPLDIHLVRATLTRVENGRLELQFRRGTRDRVNAMDEILGVFRANHDPATKN